MFVHLNFWEKRTPVTPSFMLVSLFGPTEVVVFTDPMSNTIF